MSRYRLSAAKTYSSGLRDRFLFPRSSCVSTAKNCNIRGPYFIYSLVYESELSVYLKHLNAKILARITPELLSYYFNHFSTHSRVYRPPPNPAASASARGPETGIRSTKQHASSRNKLSRCWTASRLYQAGRRFHWNSFRGSWGIWLQLRRQSRSVCSIWDQFSTGSMAESRGGRGNAVLTGFRLHRPAARPSARGQIPRSFGQECPWSRYPDMLWYSRMPRPPAGEPHTTGTQYQGFGRVPKCVGISIALSCWQYALPWAASEGAFSARTFWSVRTTLRPLCISTGKAVYAPVACRNSPAISSFGVRSIWDPFVPSTSQECSIGQPTSCLEQHFQASGDSIPRRFSWFGDGSELLRWTCLHLQKPPTARSSTP